MHCVPQFAALELGVLPAGAMWWAGGPSVPRTPVPRTWISHLLQPTSTEPSSTICWGRWVFDRRFSEGTAPKPRLRPFRFGASVRAGLTCARPHRVPVPRRRRRRRARPRRSRPNYSFRLAPSQPCTSSQSHAPWRPDPASLPAGPCCVSPTSAQYLSSPSASKATSYRPWYLVPGSRLSSFVRLFLLSSPSPSFPRVCISPDFLINRLACNLRLGAPLSSFLKTLVPRLPSDAAAT